MFVRGAIANVAATRFLDLRCRNRKGNKKDEGNYIAIAVARFVKIAIANLAIACFAKSATAKFDLTKKNVSPWPPLLPQITRPTPPPFARCTVAPLRRRLLPTSTPPEPPEPRAIDATGAAPNATGAARPHQRHWSRSRCHRIHPCHNCLPHLNRDAPASLATTASRATTGAILYKPPPLLSLFL